MRCMVWFGGPPHLLGPGEPAVDFAPVRRDLQESERDKERSEERMYWKEGETSGGRQAEGRAGRVAIRRRAEGR
jgi:hypothetical protein